VLTATNQASYWPTGLATGVDTDRDGLHLMVRTEAFDNRSVVYLVTLISSIHLSMIDESLSVNNNNVQSSLSSSSRYTTEADYHYLAIAASFRLALIRASASTRLSASSSMGSTRLFGCFTMAKVGFPGQGMVPRLSKADEEHVLCQYAFHMHCAAGRNGRS
jgi:hypothetical protein